MSGPLVVDYYSDLLCVWAWIAQRRIDELEAHWGTQITLRHHCVDVFGDTDSKVADRWGGRGGYDAFADHVRDSVGQYEHVRVHPDLWRRVRPATSGNAHLLLKAVDAVAGSVAMTAFARKLRSAFFLDGIDIGRAHVLRELAEDSRFDTQALDEEIESGRAMAKLLSDYADAKTRGVEGSPSWILNEGRQILYGNVGYRVLNANVEELLRRPEQEASWC